MKKVIEQTNTPTAIDIFNPADGRLVDRVEATDSESVADTARALRYAQPEWEALGPKGRARWLFVLQSWLVDNMMHLADVVQSETGKPRTEAEFEVLAWVDLINYFGRSAARFLAVEHPKPHNPLGWTKAQTLVYRPYPWSVSSRHGTFRLRWAGSTWCRR